MANSKFITVYPPLAGIVRKHGFQSQSPYSSSLSTNFWPVDMVTGKRVSAVRPPLNQLFELADTNLLCPINGAGEQLIPVGFAAAADGVLYWWNGTGLAEVDTAYTPPTVSTGRPVYATPFKQFVLIANDGDPLQFDYAANAGEQQLTEITASEGTVPTDCRIVVTWQGCAVWSGAPTDSHLIYISRTGDHTDYDYDAPFTDEGGAFSTAGENEGLIGGPVVALMPQTADSLIVSCEDSMYALRGHPRRGGIIENISGRIGAQGQGAWCKDPSDRLYVLTKAGLAILDSSPNAVPVEMSKQRVPDDLLGLAFDSINPVVSMAYSSRNNMVYLSVRGEEEQAWVYDLEDGGFHQMELFEYPHVMLGFSTLDSNNTCGVLWGGETGINQFDILGTEEFSYRLLAGPLKISPNATRKSMVKSAKFVFGADTVLTGSANVWVGHDGEEAYNNAIVDRGSKKFSVSLESLVRNNGWSRPRLSGHAMILELTGENGPLTFEGADCETVDAGLERTPRLTNVAPLVSAGADIAVDFPDPLIDGWAGYADATPDNPSSELTDFVFLLSLNTMPASWWSSVLSTGADIRVSNAGNELLPFDLINFNYGANTGLLAFKFTKTTANQSVRIWAGNPVAAALAANDTYGQYNTYPSHVRAFYPSGAGSDRTSFLNDLTTFGTLTVGGASGPFSGVTATTYNGTQRGVALASVPSIEPISILTWAKTTTDAGNSQAFATVVENAPTIHQVLLRVSSSAAKFIGCWTRFQGNNIAAANASGQYTDNVWSHAAAVFTSASSRKVFRAGGNAATDVVNASNKNAFGRIVLGSGAADQQVYPHLGTLALTSIHDVALSDAWVAYHAAMENQSTFWNTWSWNAV